MKRTQRIVSAQPVAGLTAYDLHLFLLAALDTLAEDSDLVFGANLVGLRKPIFGGFWRRT